MAESRITNFLNIIHFLFIINIYRFFAFWHDFFLHSTISEIKLLKIKESGVGTENRVCISQVAERPRAAQEVHLYSVYNNVYANTRGGWWKLLWGVKLSVRKEEPWPTLIRVWGFSSTEMFLLWSANAKETFGKLKTNTGKRYSEFSANPELYPTFP